MTNSEKRHKLIWTKWLISILIADVLGACCLMIMNPYDYAEYPWYFIRGLLFSLFVIPLPIILSVATGFWEELDDEDYEYKMQSLRIMSGVLVMFLEAAAVASLIGELGLLGFIGVVLIFTAYGISSFIAVWIMRRMERFEN